MTNIMKLILSHPLGVALVLLPLSILAKNLIGAGGAILKNKFNFDYFKRGLLKGFLIYSGIATLSLMSWLSTDLSVNVGGTDYTLVVAVVVLIMGAVALYIKDTFELLAIIFKQKTTEED